MRRLGASLHRWRGSGSCWREGNNADLSDDAADCLVDDPPNDDVGLDSGLYDKLGRRLDEETGSKEVEAFLFEVERDLLGKLEAAKEKDPRRRKQTDKEIRNVLKRLKAMRPSLRSPLTKPMVMKW